MSNETARAKRPRTSWPRFQWWLFVSLIFCVQLGLIFWLSDWSPPRVKPAARAPALRLAGPAASEALAFGDPTLFALPHRQGFSGLAWLTSPTQKFPSFDWSEPLQFLDLSETNLGQTFQVYMTTNRIDPASLLLETQPALTMPDPGKFEISPRTSSLRLEGALANRRLVTPIQLPAWPHTDLLSNSIVQVTISDTGQPISVTLVATSGSKAADQSAVDLARAARFDSVESNGPNRTMDPMRKLTFGLMVFDWYTLGSEPK